MKVSHISDRCTIRSSRWHGLPFSVQEQALETSCTGTLRDAPPPFGLFRNGAGNRMWIKHVRMYEGYGFLMCTNTYFRSCTNYTTRVKGRLFFAAVEIGGNLQDFNLMLKLVSNCQNWLHRHYRDVMTQSEIWWTCRIMARCDDVCHKRNKLVLCIFILACAAGVGLAVPKRSVSWCIGLNG